MTVGPKLDLVFRDSTRACPVGEAFFARVLARSLRAARMPAAKYEVSVSIIGESAMRALNKKFRRVNKSTDVLSFPLGVQYQRGYTIMALGDIFICLSVARHNAKRAGLSEKREIAWLAAHGLLHLCGYDHERSAEQARTMARLEKKSIAHIR